MEDKITVIYIIGDRRSGTTLLENILSKSDEIISVGELAMLKDHIDKTGPGFFWNWNCSCGKSIFECPFWSNVLKNIYNKDFQTKITWPYKSLKIIFSSVFKKYACKTLQKFVSTKNNLTTTETLEKIYISISQTSNKKIIVDSSKDPLQALAISRFKNIEVKYVWLTRDLRAISYSKLKRAEANKSSTKGILRILLNTTYYKNLCKAVVFCLNTKNVTVVNYEDLVSKTQSTLNKICNYFCLKNFSAPEHMELINDHTIGGTPNRFERSLIAEDASWKNFYTKKNLLNIAGKIFNSL